MAKTVVVIGAGVSGIQVTQQLADLGINVHLLEKEPFVGGLSSHLGKVFPTDDCALCVDACLELFDGNHRRCLYRGLLGSQKGVTLHTQTSVKTIKKENGRFSIAIKTEPRYVIPDRCVVCLECINVCEVEVSDEFNLARTTRKAIYRKFPQGVPLAPVIDIKNCTQCMKCVEVCHVNAIDLMQKGKGKTLKADAVVLATGVDERSPSTIPGYSYMDSDDILTQRELARLIDPVGPTSGKLMTAGGEPARTVTMIMCAGSRDLNAAEYCSQACCTYSLKHAVMLQEMGVDVTVCYMDLRIPLMSNHYLDHAREVGVTFIRGKPDKVLVRDGHPVTIVEDTFSQKRMELESDIVALAAPLTPHAAQDEAFTALVDESGFALRCIDSSGVFACGTSTGPTDIPTSIAEANSVALQVYMHITERSS